MQTRTALSTLSGGEVNYQLGDGPLGEVAHLLLPAYQEREAARLEEAHRRAAMAGQGPIIHALQNRFAREESQSLLDLSVPMVTRFEAAAALQDACAQYPGDRGLKMASAHAQRLWHKDPMGVLAVGDVARLRTHYVAQFPRSKVASVIDQVIPKVGFNTLPVQKLASYAAGITGSTAEELQQSYEAVCRTHGLTGNAPHVIRARTFLRSLVDLAEDSFEERTAGVEAGGDAAADRLLRRMACFDDPILRQVTAQETPFSDTEPAMGEGFDQGPLESPELEEQVPHEEEGETIVETESPVTGEPIVLELGLAEGGEGGEGEGEEGMEPDVTPGDVEGLSMFGQLADFGGADLPDAGTEEGIPMDEGVVETEIEDPSAPGTMLKVTLESDSGAELAEGTPPAPTSAAPIAMGDMQASRAYRVYAVRGGVKATQPMDVVAAESMPRALRLIARKMAELGPVTQEVRADPNGFGHKALIVLDASAGNHLYVVAADRDDDHGPEKGSEFYPPGGINAQQPAQVTLPGGGADGTTVLKSDGGFAQPRSTRKVDVTPAGSAVSRPGQSDGPNASGKKGALSREDVERVCAAHGLSALDIEARLLAAEPVTAGKWTLEIVGEGQVHLRTAGRTFERDLGDLDDVIADFQARAAADLRGAQPAAGGGVARVASTDTLGGLRYEARPYFQVGCAQCGKISEYTMPDTPENVRCASCSFETTAAAVAVQLETRMASAYPGYVVVSDLPKGRPEDIELNARRVMTAIHEVVPQATASIRDDSRLEVQLRPADEAALNRVCRVLEDRFGVQDLHARAARVGQVSDPSVATTPQNMQTTVPEQVGIKLKDGDVAPTFNPPAKPAPTPTSMQPNPGAPGLMQEPSPMMGPGPGAASQPVMPPPPDAPGSNPEVSVSMGAAPGMDTQQQAARDGMTMKPASRQPRQPLPRGRAGIWNVAYKGMDGRSKVMPVESASAEGARKVFAMYDGDAKILSVTAQAGPPVPPVDPVADAGPPPGGDVPPGPGGPGGPGDPMAGGPPPEQQGMGGGGISDQIKEVIRAAMITLRNTGIDIASAVDDFQSKFKKVIERFGDETSPARQMLGAEIIRAAQEAWSKPALLDLTAPANGGAGPGAGGPGVGGPPPMGAMAQRQAGPKVRTPKSGPKTAPAPTPVKHDIPTPGEINTQQPDWVSLGTGDKILGEDSATDSQVTESIVPGGKIKTQPSVPEKASGPLSSWGDGHRGTESKDPGTFGAGKPPKDGSYGLVGEGTSLTPTDLGRDSQTGNNATTSKWDSVPRTNDRSKPGGQGAPRIKGGRQAYSTGEVMRRLASLEEERGLTYLARRYESGKWFLEAVRKAKEGEFPELELWNARDASVSDGAGVDVIPQLAGPAQAAWELALSILV